MVSQGYLNYFLASTGASAALIGLLFVAVAVAPERVFGSKATSERRALAGSAFTALLNAFFISLVALIPHTNIGYVVLIMGVLSIINTLNMGRRFWENRHRGLDLQQITLLVGSFVIYGLEIGFAVPILFHSQNVDAVSNISYVLLATYSVGVGRAWELMGAENEGLFTLLGLRHASTAEIPEKACEPAQVAEE